MVINSGSPNFCLKKKGTKVDTLKVQKRFVDMLK